MTGLHFILILFLQLGELRPKGPTEFNVHYIQYGSKQFRCPAVQDGWPVVTYMAKDKAILSKKWLRGAPVGGGTRALEAHSDLQTGTSHT